MKTKLLITSLIIFASPLWKDGSSMAQIKAITEDGKKVFLYDNGNWQYAPVDNSEETLTTKKDTIEYKRPKSYDFLMKSERIKCGIYMDGKKWSVEKNTKEGPEEYNFTLKEQDAYAMIIPEKIEVPLQNLKNIAISNARSAAPDIKVINEEFRRVNGKVFYCMQMEGTIQGIMFTYLSYYYTSKGGTIQFISYTSKNLFEQYKGEMNNLLNGLTILE